MNGTWKKSSYSAHNGNCVEVADGCGLVHVRDSKDPDGPVLAFTPGEWRAFLLACVIPAPAGRAAR